MMPPMADEQSLLVDRRGHTVVLTMNRPARRNALSLDMIVRLADAWELVDGDDTIRSAILTGAEGAYCVGGDLDAGWMAGNRSTEPTEHERRAMEDMTIVGRGLLLSDWLRTPIIAVVNGDCMGGGCEMLQQTDIRIAEEHARFGVPEARRGLIAGAGSTMRLKRQIPYAVALEMLLTGRILDAEEALRWGLVTHVVPKGESVAKAHEIAAVIAANGPLSVAASKASLIETGWLPEDQASPIELGYAATVMFSKDAKEGMRAFKEKRPPEFTGE
jgi:enoyl-CoA hydratase